MRYRSHFVALTLAALAVPTAGVAVFRTQQLSRQKKTVPGPADYSATPRTQNPTPIQLVTGNRLTPAGSSTVVNDMIQSATRSPDGRFVVLVSGGAQAHGVHLVDSKSGALLQTVAIGRAQSVGAAFSPDGATLYVAGGNSGRVNVLTLSDSRLAEADPIALPETGTFQNGLSLSPDGATLFVTSLSDDTLYTIDTATRKPGARRKFPAQSRPGTVISTKDGALYLALWGDSKVLELDPKSLETRREIPVGPHPSAIVATKDRLFVACANDDSVRAIDRATGQTTETIRLSLVPNAPAGSTPVALALSPGDEFLYVACADANAVAKIEIETPGKSVIQGFVPTGQYPAAVAVSPDDKRLFVGCGKGLGTGPNPIPPGGSNGRGGYPYIANLQRGLIETIPNPDKTALAAFTKQVLQNNVYGAPAIATNPQNAPRAGTSAIPSKLGDPSPIRYVLYIIKENRTYDQVFGAFTDKSGKPAGNGDPNLTLFGEDVTPNHHALAREFVLFDNLYANGEVSADGHHWSNGAYVPDAMQRLWPAQYGAKGAPPIRYGDFGDPLAQNPTGRIWDRCADAKVPFRTYYYHTDKNASAVWAKARRDGARDYAAADIFLEDLKGYETAGEMPRFQVMALSEDHTRGATPGAFTPQAAVGSNDQAIGKIIAALSRSRFWKETAVFIIEDDAQNGPDHVDAHRTVGLVISPFTRRGAVDSTFYNTTSMLRTMELILNLKPMSVFDAGATPMYAAFTNTPDTTPYTLRAPKIDLEAKNPARTALGNASRRLDLSEPDHLTVADEDALNRILWQTIKGKNTPYPGVVRRPWFSSTGHPHKPDTDD